MASSVDQTGFNAEMAQQQERGRSSSQFAQRALISADTIASLPETEFLGYELLETADSRIAGIVVDGELSERLEEGQEAIVFLDRTPFYAESGGQVGDTGTITGEGFEFQVKDTLKVAGVFFGHAGVLRKGRMNIGRTGCGAR